MHLQKWRKSKLSFMIAIVAGKSLGCEVKPREEIKIAVKFEAKYFHPKYYYMLLHCCIYRLEIPDMYE